MDILFYIIGTVAWLISKIQPPATWLALPTQVYLAIGETFGQFFWQLSGFPETRLAILWCVTTAYVITYIGDIINAFAKIWNLALGKWFRL